MNLRRKKTSNKRKSINPHAISCRSTCRRAKCCSVLPSFGSLFCVHFPTRQLDQQFTWSHRNEL